MEQTFVPILVKSVDVDIAALAETRLANEGQVTEPGFGYTFFWKGKSQEERRIHGVGFAVKSKLVKDLNLSPTCVNERIITLRIPLIKDRYLTAISTYAPTLDASDAK